MAKTPEKRVKDACVEILKEFGAYYFFPVMGGYGRSGIPDIIACYRGRFIGIEWPQTQRTPQRETHDPPRRRSPLHRH